MDPILDTIDAALKQKGLSDAAASKLAVGHPSLIKNLRMERQGEKRYNLPSLMKLAKVLDLDFHFGPTRAPAQIEHITVEGSDYARIPLHNAWLSAGPGSENGDVAIIDHMAFRQDWLRKIGLKPEDAALARISGDSMAPGINPGDLVMIDTTRRDVPARIKNRLPPQLPVFAFIQDQSARVKRLERLPHERLLVLYSDNAAHPPEIIADPDARAIDILGQVVWSGHVWR